MRARKFKGAGYPVEERRHLLEELDTVWVCGVAQPRRVVLRNVSDGRVFIAFLRRADLMPPTVKALAVESFLRNYRREDEETA